MFQSSYQSTYSLLKVGAAGSKGKTILKDRYDHHWLNTDWRTFALLQLAGPGTLGWRFLKVPFLRATLAMGMKLTAQRQYLKIWEVKLI